MKNDWTRCKICDELDFLGGLPVEAQQDFGEYRRMGGRFDARHWWGRYKGNYERATT